MSTGRVLVLIQVVGASRRRYRAVKQRTVVHALADFQYQPHCRAAGQPEVHENRGHDYWCAGKKRQRVARRQQRNRRNQHGNEQHGSDGDGSGGCGAFSPYRDRAFSLLVLSRPTLAVDYTTSLGV